MSNGNSAVTRLGQYIPLDRERAQAIPGWRCLVICDRKDFMMHVLLYVYHPSLQLISGNRLYIQ
jgi:hypothetical protein